jgi:hypothetical protein
MYTPQQPMVARKPLVLVECHLFTFEMRDNKVFAQGFDHVRTSDHKTLLNRCVRSCLVHPAQVTTMFDTYACTHAKRHDSFSCGALCESTWS